MTLAQNPPQPLNGNSLKYFLVLIFCCGQTWSAAQEIRKIDGQRYTVHVVEKGHTLFAISKKYSVPIDQIIEHNPEAKLGLRIGAEILIPMSEVDKKAARDNPPEISGKFLTHTVEKKETLFSISKKYGVEINKILEYNPGADKDLAIGRLLKIYVGDVAVKDSVIVAPAAPDSLINHRLEQGQTFYTLTRIYKVSEDSIRQVNGGLEEGLKAGAVIRIPKYTEEFMSQQTDSLDRISELNALSGPRTVYRVALMLPFSLDIQDSVFAHSDPTKPMELYTLTRIASEIYAGVNLALDSLKNTGLNVELYVYDVAEDPDQLRRVLEYPVLDKMHLIIGPLHRSSYVKVAEFAALKGIHVVSPVPNQMLETTSPNSCVIHASAKEQMRFLGRYVARMHLSDNVVVVDSDKFKDYDYLQNFLNSYHANYRLGDSIVPVKLDKFGIESVRNKLVTDRKNVMVVPSSDLGFVSDFMNRISNIKSSDFDIQVIGMEKWRDYHNVDIAYKNRFNLIVPASSFLNFESSEVEMFVQRYRNLYERDPGNGGYAFLGFDVTWYFANALRQYGLDFYRHFEENQYEGLYLGFKFDRNSTGCHNRHIFLLQYDDYHLKKIN